MKDTLVLLLSSRKFWVGFLTISAVFAAVFLRSMNMITAEALVPTIIAITSTGLGFIGSVAWESVSADRVTAAHITANPNVKP
jgi:hypothetical protein